MADIRVNSTGRIFWGLDNGIALLLMEAFPEAFSHAGKPQQQPVSVSTTPRFCVGVTNAMTGRLAVMRKVGATVDYFVGPAEQIKETPGWESCPDSVVEQWRRTAAADRARG